MASRGPHKSENACSTQASAPILDRWFGPPRRPNAPEYDCVTPKMAELVLVKLPLTFALGVVAGWFLVRAAPAWLESWLESLDVRP